MSTLPDFQNYRVEIADKVARVELIYGAGKRARDRGESRVDPHWELYEVMNHLRTDNGVRVVVISGERDGTFMTVESATGADGDPMAHFKQHTGASIWKASTGIVRMHEAMAALDRPIIAKVNGDVVGLGVSIMYAADIIIARDDARVVDNHLGMGEVEPYRSPYGVLPGDGAAALLPLFMSPARAKEFLMLAREDRASDLARIGVINYAVPASELDAVVESFVERLLKRPAYALAWCKRVANMHVVDQLHRTLDAGTAYQLVNMYQLALEGERLDFE